MHDLSRLRVLVYASTYAFACNSVLLIHYRNAFYKIFAEVEGVIDRFNENIHFAFARQSS